MKKRGLGKGLDAIFAENNAESAEGAVSIRISEIEPNREQPRKEFDSEALSERGVPHSSGRTPLESRQNGRTFRGAGCYPGNDGCGRNAVCAD